MRALPVIYKFTYTAMATHAGRCRARFNALLDFHVQFHAGKSLLYKSSLEFPSTIAML